MVRSQTLEDLRNAGLKVAPARELLTFLRPGGAIWFAWFLVGVCFQDGRGTARAIPNRLSGMLGPVADGGDGGARGSLGHAYWSLVALAGGSEADPACDTAPEAAFGVIQLFMVSTCSMFWPLQIHHILGPEGTLWLEKKIIPRQMSPWDTSLIWTGDGPLLDGKAVPQRAVRLC